MEVEAGLLAPVSRQALFRAVEDLSTYPRWLDLVRKADPEDEPESEAGGRDGPAWDVELRGRIGPLARSKRLRMVRTRLHPLSEVRFERSELDGREHSLWVLEARVGDADEGSSLTMLLRYSGSFASSLLNRLLREEIERARPRLIALATDIDARDRP